MSLFVNFIVNVYSFIFVHSFTHKVYSLLIHPFCIHSFIFSSSFFSFLSLFCPTFRCPTFHLSHSLTQFISFQSLTHVIHLFIITFFLFVFVSPIMYIYEQVRVIKGGHSYKYVGPRPLRVAHSGCGLARSRDSPFRFRLAVVSSEV